MSTYALNESESGDVHHQDKHLAGRKKLQKNVSTTGPNSGAWIDEERQNLRAYEYLCHVGEAKEWIEACVTEDIGAITDLDQNLRNGIVLAKLAKFFEPSSVKKIFEDPKLQFRHSDNTNFFFAACKKSGLPDVFLFELTDVYDKKNIPKVIYCIHALSHFLAKKGIAPKIKNLVGKLDFTDEELQKTENSLQEAGVALPQFGNIEGALAKELQEDKETEEEKRRKYLEEHEKEIIKCQAWAKGYLQRGAYKKRQQEFQSHEDLIIKMQSQIRGWRVRKDLEARKRLWKDNETLLVKLQAQIRGWQQRKQYLNRHEHFHNQENLKKIVDLQANFRRKIYEQAYRSLSKTETIPVKTIQTFIHLLDDSDRDFQDELQLEQMKQNVMKKIRDNQQTEQLLNELDIKIALLVKNRITLDELLKNTQLMKQQKEQEKKQDLTATNASGAALPAGAISDEEMFSSAMFKSLDKERRQRLELYQSMFYILQTQPRYMARIMFLIRQTKIRAFMDHVLLTLYNYANTTREEFLLLKLFQQAISEEMKTITEVTEIMKGNPTFVKMAVHYNRGAKERLFLRDLLQPLVKEIISSQDQQLDLETDPIAIYRQLIKEEEQQTGEQSKRPYDVSKEQALEDKDVLRIFYQHIDQLKKFTDKFLDALQKNLPKMPYGIRYIANQLYNELKQKFPPKTTDDEERIMKVIGNLVYYRYMNPAIVAPEGFDVIEQLISPMQRKNLAEISKILQHISTAKLFDGELSYLSSMNDYIKQASKKMFTFFSDCALKISDAETHFQMSDLSDLVKTSKPVIYISPQEIFNAHALLYNSLDDICNKDDSEDPLRILMRQLGAPPKGTVTVDYSGNLKEGEVNTSAATGGVEAGGDSQLRGNEISLQLSSRFIESFSAGFLGASGEDSINEYKNQFIELKRLVLILVKCQAGKNLREILEKEAGKREEAVYQQLLKADQQQSKKDGQATAPLPETLTKLKHLILTGVGRLETLFVKISSVQPDVQKQQKSGVWQVRRDNNYQELLTSIGLDIRNKHRRRIQRRDELKSLQKTVKNLDDKMKYLQEQKQSYQDYINSCMAALTSNRKKQSGQSSKFIMPFSPQWKHMQDLKKNGKVPQFGSYKYSADALYKKGVLVSVDGYSSKQFDKITLTISSDETGVFAIEVSILGIKMPQRMELKLEDLLQYQFDNQHIIPIFDGAAKVNVNLLIFLINKKFYN